MVGGHATFYVQRHIPETVKVGHVLTEDDYRELRHIVRKRDTFLKIKQKRETDLGAQVQHQRARIERLEAAYRLPVIGFLFEERRSEGAYSDGAMGSITKAAFQVLRPAMTLSLSGVMPHTVPPGSTVELEFGGRSKSGVFDPGQPVKLTVEGPFQPGQTTLVIRSKHARSGMEAKINGDSRQLGLRIKLLTLE